MIGWLRGHVVDKDHPGKIVVNVQGVGYDVEMSLSTFFKLESRNDAIELHIHTIVREDALLLYGFIDKEERTLFRALIKVNGVGPKMAIAILSSITPHEFIQCIHQKNTALLTQLPGIGKKTAERLMVEMKDTLLQPTSTINSAEHKAIRRDSEEAIQALEALGYKQPMAMKLITQLDDGTKSCEQLLRQALQSL